MAYQEELRVQFCIFLLRSEYLRSLKKGLPAGRNGLLCKVFEDVVLHEQGSSLAKTFGVCCMGDLTSTYV